jgi:hypothetical protein
MSVNNISETILIRENTLLPAGLTVKSEVFLPGWRIIKNLDGYGLGRKIAEANWHFFYLAGDIGAIALGRMGPGSLHRAVKHALAKQGREKFNSLEITKAVSKRFLGIPFTSITVHFRHIQQGISLNPANDSDLKIAAAAAGGKVTAKQFTTLVPSS